MRTVSDRSCGENQNTLFMTNKLFFPKVVPFVINVKKHCKAGQATDGNMVHAHCVLNTKGYKHTVRICYNYCFSAATMVTSTLLIVTVTRTVGPPAVFR
jgi:hypothetical protein